ncbi:MAG: trigger factor [Acidimicrobiia bacterium]
MSEVKEVGRFERILTFTIDAAALEAGKRSAAGRLAKDAKIKGFRPGKAPLKVVESMVGSATLRREAIDDAIPKALAAAIRDTDLLPVVFPRLEEVRDTDGGVEVDVRITLWPTIDRLPAVEGRRIQIARPEVTDDDVDTQIERMRDQFAELEDVSREAFDGDFVLADVKTRLDGEDFAAGSATDMLYEIGSGSLLEGLDEALRGSASGRILEFPSVLPAQMGEQGGRAVEVRVLVKGVKAKRLPELTDDWVSEVSEFETVAEMRAELTEQIRSIRLRGLRADFEGRLLAELIEDTELELPDSLVEAEMDSVFHRFAHRLETQGIELDRYLELTGQSRDGFAEDLRSQASLNLRSRILLESVAETEGIEVTAAELDEAIAALAAVAKVSVDDYRAALEEGGQGEALSGDILRRKAVDRLLELAVPVDEEGNEIELPAPATPGDETGETGDDDEGEGEKASVDATGIVPEPTEVE